MSGVGQCLKTNKTRGTHYIISGRIYRAALAIFIIDEHANILLFVATAAYITFAFLSGNRKGAQSN